MKSRMPSILNQQKGTALIIAIGMLAVLSILGTVVLTTSTRDLGLSGGVLPARQTFYTADRAVEYAMNPELLLTIKSDSDPRSIDLTTAPAEFEDFTITPTKKHIDIIESFGVGTLNFGRVTRGDDVSSERLNEIHEDEPESVGAGLDAAYYRIEISTTANSSGEARIDVMAIAEKTIMPFGGGGSGGSSGGFM